MKVIALFFDGAAWSATDHKRPPTLRESAASRPETCWTRKRQPTGSMVTGARQRSVAPSGVSRTRHSNCSTKAGRTAKQPNLQTVRCRRNRSGPPRRRLRPRRCRLLAHRVISRQRRMQVALGPKGTLTGRQDRLHRSRMTQGRHSQFQPPHPFLAFCQI